MKRETLLRIILLALAAVLILGAVRNLRLQVRRQRYQRQQKLMDEQPITRQQTSGMRYTR